MLFENYLEIFLSWQKISVNFLKKFMIINMINKTAQPTSASASSLFKPDKKALENHGKSGHVRLE